jgi:hypothetical protein
MLHQGAVWRRGGRSKPHRSGETGHQTLHPHRRRRATARCHHRPREPARPPAASPTLDTLKDLGPLPDDTCVHLDAGYHSHATRQLLTERELRGQIASKGIPAPVQATRRWPVERTHAWHNNFYKLARCTERRQIVADFYIALANTVILIRRLLRRAWTLYRWDTRPPRRP